MPYRPRCEETGHHTMASASPAFYFTHHIEALLYDLSVLNGSHTPITPNFTSPPHSLEKEKMRKRRCGRCGKENKEKNEKKEGEMGLKNLVFARCLHASSFFLLDSNYYLSHRSFSHHTIPLTSSK